jgi:hypothetical protein
MSRRLSLGSELVALDDSSKDAAVVAHELVSLVEAQRHYSVLISPEHRGRLGLELALGYCVLRSAKCVLVE